MHSCLCLPTSATVCADVQVHMVRLRGQLEQHCWLGPAYPDPQNLSTCLTTSSSSFHSSCSIHHRGTGTCQVQLLSRECHMLTMLSVPQLLFGSSSSSSSNRRTKSHLPTAHMLLCSFLYPLLLLHRDSNSMCRSLTHSSQG